MLTGVDGVGEERVERGEIGFASAADQPRERGRAHPDVQPEHSRPSQVGRGV
jgi:hypothetical protein